METFTNLLQMLGGIILSVGYIPQIRQIIKTRDVSGLNFNYTLMVFIGCFCMEVYAIYNLMQGVAGMFFITNTLSTALAGTMFALKLIFSKREVRAVTN